MKSSGVEICGHPLLADRLARLRDRSTPPERFRALLEEASQILGVFALSGLRARTVSVRTPLRPARARVLAEPVVLAAVLRAGLGMLSGLLRVLPEARVGHIGLYRDEQTLAPVRYYARLPKGLSGGRVLLLDPMLATGGSAAEAVRILKEAGARRVTLVCLLAARPGALRLRREHPDVRVVTAAVDPALDSNGYIVPGLGDAGDRLFGTL